MLNATFLSGINKPLILLHGFLGTQKDWDPFLSHMGNDFCSISLDLPGHGKSPLSPTIDTLVAWIESLELKSFHLMGYSMGGRLALALSRRFKKNVSSLILIGSHLGLKAPEEKKQRLENDLLWARLINENYPLFLEKWYDQDVFTSLKSNPELRKLLLKSRHHPLPERLSHSLIENSLAHQNFYIPEVPSLCIYGEHDLKFKNYYHSLLPQITLYEIPHAGHTVHLENPKELAKVTHNFLRKII